MQSLAAQIIDLDFDSRSYSYSYERIIIFVTFSTNNLVFYFGVAIDSSYSFKFHRQYSTMSADAVAKDDQTTDDEDLSSTEKNPSPMIENIKWGCVNVERFGRFKDVKLYPGGESVILISFNTHLLS